MKLGNLSHNSIPFKGAVCFSDVVQSDEQIDALTRDHITDNHYCKVPFDWYSDYNHSGCVVAWGTDGLLLEKSKYKFATLKNIIDAPTTINIGAKLDTGNITKENSIANHFNDGAKFERLA